MPKQSQPNVNPITLWAAMTTYLSYAILIVFGHCRDFFAWITGSSRYTALTSKPRPGFARLLDSWGNFYSRRLYDRIIDVFNRPITGPAGAHINLIHRTKKNGKEWVVDESKPTKKCLNLGSYNYLGFADDWNKTCRDDVVKSLDNFCVGSCGPRWDAGTTTLHKELEDIVAKFVGKEAAFVFNMGYGTNSTGIPALMGHGSLIVSDSLNHTSIVNGARASGAVIKVFQHNNSDNLEAILREAIADGQPRTHRPWKKILVMVEGVYSMEGELCDLKSIVRVAKKYKAYIYVDEAHSIGAVGKTGRGVCEHCGVDPKDVDVLMGTFTKSFGGMGGYIAGSKDLVDSLKQMSLGSSISNAMSPVIVQQVITAFKIIQGKDGTNIGKEKLRLVKENSDYFRAKLKEMGCEVFGDEGSPVVPLMLYHPAKIAAFSRECLEQGLAVVVVGFPATPLVLSRARFCISAGHTRKDLDVAIEKIRKIATRMKLRYRKSPFG